MRLAKLDHGHPISTKLMFLLIRVISGSPVPDVVKTLKYRWEFFGANFSPMVQTLLRGESMWSIGERELFAAWTSRLEACRF
jgi:hypothetical protein